MPCFHPKLAWGKRASDGSFEDIQFKKSKANYLILSGYEKLELPCGTCLGCRLEYSRQWMLRCSMEAKCWPKDTCWFVTLTYDDEHLPISEAYRPIYFETGEVMTDIIPSEYVPSLSPSDFTLFMKKLREDFRRRGYEDIRFYACGEYGSQHFRPHYHISFFNLPLTDLKIRDKLDSGFYEFNSPKIEQLWGKGRISVSPFSPETAGYVARYVMKKAQGCDKDFYQDRGLYPEFVRMSRRPGIGAYYLEQNKERIVKYDMVAHSGRSFKPPKYFDKLLLDDPLYQDYVRINKELRQEYSRSKLPPETSLFDPNAIYKSTPDQYLSLLESVARDRVRGLPRKLV